MKQNWRLAGWAALACSLLVVLALVIDVPGPVRDQHHSLWSSYAISNPSANDIWIEYNSISSRIVSIYRDHDGDGLVDEYLSFAGPTIGVGRASDNDGVMDAWRSIHEPLDSEKRLPRDAPEAGPFTRDKLDELARIRPMYASSDDIHRER